MAAIATYRVSTIRLINGRLPNRAVLLEASPSEPGPFKHFAIYFYESVPSDLGYVNPSNRRL
jgi:hypothetical protein